MKKETYNSRPDPYNLLDAFWKSQLNKENAKGKLSKILKAALDEKRREIIKENTPKGA